MELRKLGRSDLDVTSISLGCWVMGGSGWGGADDHQSIDTIRAALEAGINFLDTAEAYGGGHSEDVIAQALSEGKRPDVHICTKVAPSNIDSDDKIAASLKTSMERLKTDQLDVYMVHWPRKNLPVKPIIEAMEKYRRQGLFKAIGVSNFNLDQMTDSLEVAHVDVLQVPYSMFWRNIEGDLLDFCIENEVGIMAYSPICRGLLTGKFTRDWQFPEGDGRPRDVLFRQGNFETCLDAVDKLRPIAERLGKTLSQLAIAWVAQRPGITTAVVGARTAQQLQENLGAQNVTIPQEVMDEIDEICRPVLDIAERFPNPFDVVP